MRFTRALTAVAATVLLATTTLAGSTGTAVAAAGTESTVVKFDNPVNGTGYGDYFQLWAKVFEADGTTPVYDGTVTVNTRPVGGTTWTPLFTSAHAFLIEGFELSESAEYQAVYSGGTSVISDTTYLPATSPILRVDVTRGMKVIQKSAKKACYQVGPLSAPYKKKAVKTSYQVGKSKKWKYAWTFKTNKKSQYCFKLTKSQLPKSAKKAAKKAPKLKASKVVFKKSGGMKKFVKITNFGL